MIPRCEDAKNSILAICRAAVLAMVESLAEMNRHASVQKTLALES
jgi:hypothetical protein